MNDIWTDIKPLDADNLREELILCTNLQSRVGVILASEQQKREMICQFAIESAGSDPRNGVKTTPWVADVAASTLTFDNGSVMRFISQNQDVRGMFFDRVLCDVYTDPEKVLKIYLEVVRQARDAMDSEFYDSVSGVKQEELFDESEDNSPETEAWLNRFPVRAD